MSASNKKKLLIGFLLFLLLISIPITLTLMSRQQDTRSQAAGSTTLSFVPTSSTTNPITKKVGDTIALDMMVNPGTNLVTFVRYQVTYDPAKVKLAATPFTLNSPPFLSVEGPITSSGSISHSVSIGADPTKAIQTTTKIGTLNFTAIGATNGTPTTITFGPQTQALSAGSGDQANQNVLASTTPATIVINTDVTPNPTSTQQPTISGTSISFTLLLHGIGSAGDNPNPKTSTLSNKNPLHPQRTLDIQVYNTNNQLVASTSAPITFDKANGTFVGKVGLNTNVPEGNYNIKIKTDRYLRHLIPGIQQIKASQENPIPTTEMIAGDTNGDNFLNALDYNALLDCGYGELNPLPIADTNSTGNTTTCKVHTPVINIDLDDNGVINSFDYNLFLRELSVQNGD